MAERGNRARPWSFYSDRGIATLSATIAGKRHRPSLHIPYDPATASARDVRLVEEAAAKKYAELVAGRTLAAKPSDRVLTDLTLEEAGGLWLLEAKKLWPKGWKTRVTQLANVTTWANEAERFKDDKRTPFERLVDDAGPEQYAADRLSEVLRDTIEKEISNLWQFLKWALREKKISAIPKRPEMPRTAIGTRSGPQREEPVDITEAEALAICAKTPEWAVKGGRGIRPGKPLPPKAFRVRDVLRFSWEQALRPGDSQKIEKPRHWTNGQKHLFITRDIDKTGFEGRIPLTKASLEILERCSPPDSEPGLIFGKHDLRNHIKAAALAVLPPEKAKRFAKYDFRHGRAVNALETTNDLLGTSRLLRHSQLTTTNRYLRTREAHVESLVEQLDAVRSLSGPLTVGSEEVAPEVENVNDSESVRRRGLEPLRCYPLAPQGRTQESFSSLSSGPACQTSPENTEEPPPDDTLPSGRCQDDPGAQYVLAARRKLTFESALWDAFDAFALAAELEGDL